MAKETKAQTNQIECFKVRYENEDKKLKFDTERYMERESAKKRLKALKEEHLGSDRECSRYTVQKIIIGASVVQASKPKKAAKKTEPKPEEEAI